MSKRELKMEDLDPEMDDLKELMGDEFDDFVKSLEDTPEGPEANEEPVHSAEFDDPEGTEGQPEEKPEEQQAKKAEEDQKMVDVRALQQARAAERELKRQLEEDRAQRAQLEDRMNKILLSMEQGKESSKPKPPDPNKDPIGAIAHDVSTLKAEREAEAAERARIAQEEAEYQQAFASQQKMVTEFESAVAPFAQEDPTLVGAGDYLVNSFRTQLEQQGLQGQALARALLANLAQQAQVGMSAQDGPAGYLKRLAAFHGWDGSASAAQQAEQGNDPAATMKQLEENHQKQQRHKSLSGASGGAAPKTIDAKTIASMSEEEFARFMSRSQRNRDLVDVLSGAD